MRETKRITKGRTRRERERATDRQTEGQRKRGEKSHCEREGGERDRQRRSQRETETERSRERKRESGGGRESEKKHIRHILCYKMYKTLHGMKRDITPKVSPRLPSVSSSHTSHSVKQGHPSWIKQHFHSVSISIVIFRTDLRATGSSSLVVYSKQYRISV